jgi:hypothetical protein
MQFDARLGREPFYRLAEADVIDPLDEPDHISADTTSEAVKEATRR